MIRITQQEPHKSALIEKVCRKCGVTFEFTTSELKEGKSTDYTGDTDYYKFVNCPNCQTEIHHP